MRKGFTLTLLAIAIAIMGFNAMAAAPTIGTVPSIIIGDGEGSTSANDFVYPDAIDLTQPQYISDDVTSTTDIIWSFWQADGGSTYAINNVGPLDLGTELPATPPAAKVFLGPTATTTGDPEDGDASLRTVTFRNEHLSPAATAPGPFADPGPAGILPAESKLVYLFASDSDKATSEAIMIYTDNDGLDDTSGVQGVDLYTSDFVTQGLNGWVYQNQEGTAMVQDLTNGLCLTAPLTGNNMALYRSPKALFDLVDNAVYKIRLQMDSTQTTANKTPVWDVIVDNASGVANLFMFGGDFWVCDNNGGATGIKTSAGRTDYQFYFTPARVNLPAWKSTTDGAFQTAVDADNDFRLRFRVLDRDASGYGAEFDEGQVCLQNINVTRYDQSALVEGTVYYNENNYVAGDAFGPGSNSSALSFAGGVATLTPSAALTTEIDQLRPGSVATADPNNPAYTAGWPVPWNNDELLKVEYSISAATAANDQPDIFRILVAPSGQEFFAESWVQTWKWGASSVIQGPALGTPETIVSYVYTHNKTVAGAAFEFMRPRLDLMHNNTVADLAGDAGATSIHSCKVTKIVAAP